MICAFTGHRPKRLPWGTREDDPRCRALKIQIDAAITQMVDRGCRTFLCGMALGCDTYFAEAVLLRRTEGLRLIAMLPCPGQADRWSVHDKQRYEALLLQCDEIKVLEPYYSDGCMLRRNRAMVDLADYLISVYDGRGGGTGSTVDYAVGCGLEVVPLWL